MVVDAVRAYLDAASGFTELTRKRAVSAAKTLLKEGDERSNGAVTRAADTARSAAESVESSARTTRVGTSIQSLAADLIETSRANRTALRSLVEGEVERVLDRLDLVRREDHERLVRRVAELERRLASQAAVQRVRRGDTAADPAPVAAATAAPTAMVTQPVDDAPAEAPAPGGAHPDSPGAAPEEPAAPEPGTAAGADTANTADAPDPEPAAKGGAKAAEAKGAAKSGGKGAPSKASASKSGTSKGAAAKGGKGGRSTAKGGKGGRSGAKNTTKGDDA